MTGRLYLSPPHMGPDEVALVQDAFRSNWIAPLGPHVDAFEKEFAAAVGVPHAAALSSGTAALHLALQILGVRQALTIEPQSAPVLNYLGYMNADRDVRVEEALGLIQKAVELDPQSAAYQDSLGWALFRLNRLEGAELAVRRALEKDADNAVILDHLGDILAKRGQVAEALHHWQKALKGEDEEGELDRPRVEAKVREAQGALKAQQQPPSTPTP